MHGTFYCWFRIFPILPLRRRRFRTEGGGNQQDGFARRKNLYGDGHGKANFWAKGLRFVNVKYRTIGHEGIP